ncbi:MAG: type I restriction enzyme HsdR N-terminal domain-containing protein [Sphingomicrobium sp.]
MTKAPKKSRAAGPRKPRARAKLKIKPAPAPPARVEAELETRIVQALTTAFPTIDPDSIVQQRRFTVRLGHETHEFETTAQWEKHGRADILLFRDGRPLAVLEVKRETVALQHADYEQAQSYANMLTPRPPLVIVTNGDETCTYDAQTGEPWSAGSDAEATVQKLLVNAAKIAAADMRWAIEALMGRETDVWPRVVRGCTTRLLNELTDPPGASGRAIAQDLLFPRIATARAIEALKSGAIFTVVDGPPAVGKTNLLRELALQTVDSDELAVLMLRGSGPGLFQAIANLFACEFEWTLTPQDARQWLRRMSHGSAGPALVVAVDGVSAGTRLAADLQELVSLNPGPQLKVIVTTDQREGLTRTANGRSLTGLGAHSAELELGPLGLEEFKVARQVLEDAKIQFSRGAEYCEDYRAPWVLRTIYNRIARDPRYANETMGVRLPASLDLELIDEAREAFAAHSELARGYRVLARDSLAGGQAAAAELALAESNGFVVRQDALSPESQARLSDLRATGHVRTFRKGRIDVVVPTIPAAFLVELAEAAGEELADRMNEDPKAAGVWLGKRLEGVYLGDLIGAQAIRNIAEMSGGFSSGIVAGLLSIKPREELVESKLIAFATPEGETVHLKIEAGKAWIADRFGNVQGDPVDLGAERSRMLADVTGWMILGQLAHLPTAQVGNDRARMDAQILFEIGQCPFPLLRANESGLGHFEHDLGKLGRVPCPDHGAIEAATRAMAALLSRPWDDDESYVAAILEEGSLPLMHRLMIALQTVRSYQTPDRAQWADEVLRKHVVPAIKATVDAGLKRAAAAKGKRKPRANDSPSRGKPKSETGTGSGRKR